MSTNDIPKSIWSPAVHQVMRGFTRDEAIYLPMRKKIKLPFTRAMILSGADQILRHLIDPLLAVAMHAAMCLGFMFLFRKSEFLTGPDGLPRKVNSAHATLVAEDLFFWYGSDSYPATAGMNIPATHPEMISMFIAVSKGDQFGKGATRFFIAEPSNPLCMVKVVHTYCRAVTLRKGDPVFAGPKILITSTMISSFMKATATLLKLDATKIAIHSIRIGGLVTLFAAGVPDSLKQLAGRWASPTSFIVYARATMQQFGQIASALNCPNLVTPEHIRMFYQHTTGNTAQ